VIEVDGANHTRESRKTVGNFEKEEEQRFHNTAVSSSTAWILTEKKPVDRDQSIRERDQQPATMLQRSLRLVATAFLAVSTVPLVDALAPNKHHGRRAFVELVAAGGSFAALGAPLPAMAEQEKEYRQGNEVTAFNGLAFNYRGGETGLPMGKHSLGRFEILESFFSSFDLSFSDYYLQVNSVVWMPAH
jgi:hypothetical protein